jgi:hypothetical protein
VARRQAPCRLLPDADGRLERFESLCCGVYVVKLCFDRGTILLIEPHADLNLTRAPGVVWDPRVGAHRAPASSLPALRSWLHEAGVAFEDAVPAGG